MVRSAQAAVYDEYLEANMRIVLEALVEAMLVQRPSDVEQFCFDFLLQWHKEHDTEQEEVQQLLAERDALLRRRDAVRKQLEGLGPPESEAIAESAPVADAGTADGAADAADDADEAAEAASTNGTKVEYDADEAAEQEKIRAMQSRPRRVSVSAQRIDSKDIGSYVKPVHAKSEEDNERIKVALKESKSMQVICGHVDGQPLQDIVNAFYTKEFPSGVDIINQGDDGDCLYIIKEGSVNIFVARPGADGKLQKGEKGSKVVTWTSGAVFGELALMYSAPRAATVTVASETVVAWVLDATDFKMMLVQSSKSQLAKYEGWLAGVDLLKPLNHFELATLADALESDAFDPGEEIVKQGDVGDSFYILEDGSAAAFILGDCGEKEVKIYDQVGDYFGEIALLSDVPRAATVRAAGQGASVVKLSKEDFTNLLGPINDILREHIDQYPHYAEFLSETDNPKLPDGHSAAKDNEND